MDIITLAAAKKYTDDKLISGDNGGAVVDNTLTTSGAAADAKVTGDKIKELNIKFDNIELPDVPTKVSQLDNDSKFITEKYYLDNREFYDDRVSGEAFTLQTHMTMSTFATTPTNDSYTFFSNLDQYYEKDETGEWYIVDKLILNINDTEWATFESDGNDIIRVKPTYDHGFGFYLSVRRVSDGEQYFKFENIIRDVNGNMVYEWEPINVDTDLLPPPAEVMSLPEWDLDYVFYGMTGNLKKIDNKFIDIKMPTVPTKVSELSNDSNFITINDVNSSLSDYVTKNQMPEIDIDEIVERTTDGINRYYPLTEDWIDNSALTLNSENFESNSNYCITPKINVWSGREYVAILGDIKYNGYVAMYDSSGNYITTSYITGGIFYTQIDTRSIQYVRFNVSKNSDITTTIEKFNNKFRLELLSEYKLKDNVQLPNDVEIPGVPTKVSELENDSGYVTFNELRNLPEVTEADNGKVLMVVNGTWQAVNIEGLTVITENE